METKRKAKKKYKIVINEEWCKGYGCQICVASCPVKVFDMKGLKAAVVNPDACTGCLQCEIKCPDFAIEVEEIE